MYDNLLTNEPLRRISRGRVRFTYRIDKARLEELGLQASNTDDVHAALQRWFTMAGGGSYRFEVTKTGRVRVTARVGDDDEYLRTMPKVLQECLLHDTQLQGTLTNAITLATESGAYV